MVLLCLVLMCLVLVLVLHPEPLQEHQEQQCCYWDHQ